MYPSLSPDGSQVAFSKMGAPGIYVAPASGGPMHRLTEQGAHPVWSPDGQWIVFRSGGPPTVATTDQYFPANSSLWLMKADGSQVRKIVGLETGPGQAFPTWKADSTEIRFVNYAGKQIEMWTYDLATQARRRRFATTDGGFGSAIFRRDDRAMFYISAHLNGDISIWQQPLHPDSLTPDGEPAAIYRSSVGVPRDLALSPDQMHLVYAATVPDSRVQVITLSANDTATGDPITLTHETSYRFLRPQWAPGDKQLAINVLPKSKPPQIALLSYPDGHLDQIGTPTEMEYFPMYPSQGTALYFVASDAARSWVALKRLSSPDGLAEKVQALPLPPGQVSLSPDGKELLIDQINYGVLHIWRLNLTSGMFTPVTSGSDASGYTRYSHDGRYILYQRLNGSQSNIAIMPAAGPPATTNIYNGVGYAYSWSPDDSKVAYAGYENGIWNLYWTTRDGKQRRQLTQNSTARIYYRYPDWSHDGKKMALEYNETRGNLYMAELK